jgi:hypothetical protein
MPQGDKSKYSGKQKRQAEHIEEGYEKRGVSKGEAERHAWATVNKSSSGGKNSGSRRGKKTNSAPAEKGGKTRNCRKAALLPSLDAVCHRWPAYHCKYYQYRGGHRGDGCCGQSPDRRSSPSLLCVIRPRFGRFTGPYSVQDLFGDSKMVDPFHVRLRRHNIRGSDHWAEVLRGTFIPTISLNGEFLAALIAVLGTTISPYLLFWQSGEEVEQTKSEPNEKPLKKAPQQAPEQLQRIKIDTYIGMAFSNLIAYFIILTAAATLHAHGKTDINSAAEAAEALAHSKFSMVDQTGQTNVAICRKLSHEH